MAIEKALYTATATATGGRDGRAVSSDGFLDVKLTTPRELGGAGGEVAQGDDALVAQAGLAGLGEGLVPAAQGARHAHHVPHDDARRHREGEPHAGQVPVHGEAGVVDVELLVEIP